MLFWDAKMLNKEGYSLLCCKRERKQNKKHQPLHLNTDFSTIARLQVSQGLYPVNFI